MWRRGGAHATWCRALRDGSTTTHFRVSEAFKGRTVEFSLVLQTFAETVTVNSDGSVTANTTSPVTINEDGSTTASLVLFSVPGGRIEGGAGVAWVVVRAWRVGSEGAGGECWRGGANSTYRPSLTSSYWKGRGTAEGIY